MPVLKNVLGLDLGSHSIKAVEFQQSLRGFEAVQVRTLPRTDEEIPLPELIRRFLALHRFATGHVVAALPGDTTSSRRLSFPFREKRKLAAAVPFELGNDLPFDLDDFVVDWEVVDEDRVRADVAATFAPREQVSGLIATLAEAGCDPRTIEAEGLVLGNLAVVFDLPGTRLLADLGHRKSTFCLLVEGQAVAARTITVGGQQLSEALAADRGCSLEEAERIKCEQEIISRRGALPATDAFLDRFAREIVRTLGSFEALATQSGGDRISCITLFGGTAQLQGLDEFLTERCNAPAERLGLPISEHGKGLVAGGPPILFAPAIALGLRGTAQTRTHMDFRQDEFAMRLDLSEFRKDFGLTAVLAAAAVVLALLSFGSGLGVENRRANALEGEMSRLYAEALPGEPVPSSALAGLREAVRSANERAEFLGVYRGNLSALDLLAEVSRHIPKDLEIGFEELNIDRQLIRMKVHAKSFEAADRLGAELAKFEPFAQARIGSIETDRKSGGKRFNVTISLAPAGERG
jgi:general secretion pathway protein L